MNTERPIFLIAHPRSGTHALTSMIGQMPNMFVFGEVFNPSADSETYPANYYNFLNALQDTPISTPKNSETRFNSYLAYLAGRAQHSRFLVDVKYDTLHLFDAELRDVSAPPGLFSFLSKRGIAVVHLKRNLFQIYISLLNATASGQWQVLHGESIKHSSLVIDVEHMLSFLEKKSFEQQQVSRYVRSTASYIEVWYEQLFGAGSVGALQNLSTFLHLPDLAEQKPTFTKQISRPYAELIENYDEVESALNTSQFASLIGAYA